MLVNHHHPTINHTDELIPSRNSQCSVDSGMVNKNEMLINSIVIISYSQPKSVHSRMILWLLSGCG